MQTLFCSVFINGKLQKRCEIEAPVVVGRQDSEEPGPVSVYRLSSGYNKLIIAPLRQKNVSRSAALIQFVASDLIEITNQQRTRSFSVKGAQDVSPKGSTITPNDTRIMISAEIELLISQKQFKHFNTSSDHFVVSKPDTTSILKASDASLLSYDEAINRSENVRNLATASLIKQALSVVRKSARTADFFSVATKAAASIVGLNRTELLMLEEGEWIEKAMWSNSTQEMDENFASKTLVEKVCQDRATVIFGANHETHAIKSLVDIERAVASPILDTGNNVIGILYGDRPLRRGINQISDVEATLFELLAEAISSGLRRLNEERRHAQMAQFFSPKLAELISENPRLLQSREAEITTMFCDIRNFTSITSRLGSEETVKWLNAVLSEISDCILAHHGVLVDYVGDEVFAMWGAPEKNVEHSQLACAAANAIGEVIQRLKSRWEAVAEAEFSVGIGIDSGKAIVGNVGSRAKFKYGPLGNVVNTSSRLQGITKQLGIGVIISAATAMGTTSSMPTRRLGSVFLKGLPEPVSIYELMFDDIETNEALKVGYEASLKNFESQKLEKAVEGLERLSNRFPQDTPTKLLLSQVVSAMSERPTVEAEMFVMPKR